MDDLLQAAVSSPLAGILVLVGLAMLGIQALKGGRGSGCSASGPFGVVLIAVGVGMYLGIIPTVHTERGLADLTIVDFDLDPSVPDQGSPVSVRASIRNQGTRRACCFRVEWWPSESFSAPGCSWRIDDLPAGGQVNLRSTYAGYSGWHAGVTTRWVADASDDVREADEENNIEALRTSVRFSRDADAYSYSESMGIPDLRVVELVLGPATPEQGVPVVVRIRIANAGGARAEDFTVVWWSSDQDSEPACAWRVAELPAGESVELSSTFAGYPKWHHRVATRAEVDPEDEVAESDEGNNSADLNVAVLRR